MNNDMHQSWDDLDNGGAAHCGCDEQSTSGLDGLDDERERTRRAAYDDPLIAPVAVAVEMMEAKAKVRRRRKPEPAPERAPIPDDVPEFEVM